MTYRIANVRFNASDARTYPVNCDRADIEPGDVVVVAMPEHPKRLKKAVVECVEFKNWNCKNSIVCRYSELQIAADGSWSANRDYLNNGQMHTVHDLQVRLGKAGWIPHVPRQSTWKVIYTMQIGGQSAEILFRKNGIDLRVPEKSVNHWYFESEVDLYELCWSFAEKWRAQSGDYDEFFQQRGRKFLKPEGSRSDLADIYEAISGGMGGPAYLSDGVWIGAGGSTWDEHR